MEMVNLYEAQCKLPDFLIIGAQKAGTTSLYHYLIQHPHIDTAVTKEVHYFDMNYDKGKQWYIDQFPSLTVSYSHLTGEASPYYIFHPLAPSRIYEMMPRAKIIILLRNPIDRAFSHYHHNVRKRREPLNFEDAINQEEARLAGELESLKREPNYKSVNYQHYSYLNRGIYVDQLQQWYELFPRDQILVINYEHFFGNLPRSMNDVTDFLGVYQFECQYEPHNQGTYDSMNPRTRDQLREYFYPHNQRLNKFLGQTYEWN